MQVNMFLRMCVDYTYMFLRVGHVCVCACVKSVLWLVTLLFVSFKEVKTYIAV
jgi:hypothetical protein